MRRTYIGIDPGANGAVAWTDGKAVTALPLRGKTLKELSDELHRLTLRVTLYSCERGFERKAEAVLEKVGGYISGSKAMGSAMFNFGKGVGRLEALLTVSGIPYREITPAVWQKRLGIDRRGKDETKVAFKNRLRDTAAALFPGIRVTLATADALLIMEYCRRTADR